MSYTIVFSVVFGKLNSEKGWYVLFEFQLNDRNNTALHGIINVTQLKSVYYITQLSLKEGCNVLNYKIMNVWYLNVLNFCNYSEWNLPWNMNVN